jgi:hypothetical protein
VFKGCNIKVGEVSLAALVIGMALVTSIRIRQAAMQAEIAGPLFDDIDVAIFTAISCGATPRCMTQSAFLLKLSMGGKSGYWFI